MMLSNKGSMCLGWFAGVVIALTGQAVVHGQSNSTAHSATASQSNTTAYSATTALSASIGQTASSADDEAIRLRFIDYEIRLNAILKTRRDEEKKFIADVLTMVREGKLPEPLVEQSYQWVLNKRPRTNYPFVYFERVLRLLAEQNNLEIPAFDYEIYRVRANRR